MPSQGEQIAAFLRARYTEARERENGKRRSIPSPFDGHEVEVCYSADAGTQVIVNGHPYPAEKYFEIATEPAPDPDVLADLDAKIAVLDEHQDVNDGDCGTCVNGHWGYPTHGSSSPQAHPCRALRHLALPFAVHPDYDERWRP